MNRKIYSAVDQAKSFVQRELNYTFTLPVQVLLFMTYRCTSQCKMCKIWRAGETCDPNKELTLEEWKQCLDNIGLKRLKSVEIFGGDSLLRKDVSIPLVEYVHQKNSKIYIDYPTNCNLLDKQTAFDLVRAGVTNMYISLDAPPQIHDKIRGRSGTCSSVEHAIHFLRAARDELKIDRPEIRVNCTISSLNVNEFEQIIPICEECGADVVEFEYVGEFKQEHIDQTTVNGLHPTPFYVSPEKSNLLSYEQAVLLKRKMKHIRDMQEKSRMKLITYAIDALTIDNMVKGTVPNDKCYYCRYCAAINPYGDVIGCFHYNNYVIGNVKKESFESMWNTGRHRQFLDAQKRGDIKLCEHCVSGVNRNPSFRQSLYRGLYFNLKNKGFDTL